MKRYIWKAFKDDIDPWDITTQTFVSNPFKKVVAEVRANQAGRLAGMQEVLWFLGKLGLCITSVKKDGKEFKKGELILRLEGPAGTILPAERTLLNVLQRMSGIATYTSRIVRKLPKTVKLLGTRKTLWGLLDKRAISVGGGYTHRLNLGDSILVKENHASLTKNYDKSLKKIFKKANKLRFVEVEVESTAEAENFLAVYEKYKSKYELKGRVAVMLDDFKQVDIKKLAPKLKKAGLLVEVSGGVVEETVKKYALAGVGAISSGAVTNKAPAIDMSLRILK